MKHLKHLIIYSFIVIILIKTIVKLKRPISVKIILLLKARSRKDNAQLYKILDTMETKFISKGNIPESLQSRICIVNVPNLKLLTSKKKCELVLNKLCEKNMWGSCRNDLVIFDVLRHIGAYFPSMHTDIEWNKVENDGFQVWCLEYNHNITKQGTMFIFENTYLEQKYRHIKYFLRPKNGKILVIQNCLKSEYILGGINEKYILEILSIDQFINTTTKYYLDFEEGDCMMFEPNLLHMSDYRDNTNLRQSFNFRVAFKDKHGSLRINPTGCGYVNSISKTLHNPSKYQLANIL